MNWTLSSDEIVSFNRLRFSSIAENKPMVLWGWKRDKIVESKREPESRTIYFSADLNHLKGKAYIERAFFFLETRAVHSQIKKLKKDIGDSHMLDGYRLDVWEWADPEYRDYSRLRIKIGEPTIYDTKSVERRLKGKPRLSIDAPKLVPEYPNYDLSFFAPFALCAGSGLSAESGLPLLGAIHDIFEVDNMASGELIFGDKDGLPAKLAADINSEFEKYCDFTIQAVRAKPSASHELLADMYKKGIIKQVFTDNMDDIFEKVDVPYTKTRLSIFPDRYPTKFHPSVNALLVVGVAVDRRDVIKQARAKGLKIISINPVYGVAPLSRNMDYLARGDIFYREKAINALPKIIEASGFDKSFKPEEAAYSVT
jgi:hypothetical protein